MISVCIATYNGAKYIKAQLESILKQLSDSDEVIISDDGSVDDTIDIINDINDHRISVLNSGGIGNPTFNFENAIKHAVGDVIFLADQDDVWLDTKVSTIMSYMDDGAKMVLSNCKVVDEDFNVINPSYFSLLHSKETLVSNLIQNRFIGCCMAFRSSIISDALPFPKNIPAHDWWLGLVGLKSGEVAFCEEPLMLYRRHGGNASSTSEKSRTPLSKRINWRLNLFVELVKIR